MKIAGVTLIIIGLLMVIFTGFNFKTKEKVLDVGQVEINKEKNHVVNWPPILGGVFILGGIIALYKENKRLV